MPTFDRFEQIPLFQYGFIMAGPPWSYENWSAAGEHKNASAKYTCMCLDDIAQKPVSHIAAPACLLWIWATNPL